MIDAFKIAGSVILKTNDCITGLSDISEKAGETSNALSSKLTSAGDTLTGIGKALMPVTLAIGGIATVSVSTYATFEDAMLKVQSLLGATGTEMNALTSTAEEFGRTTAWSATDVANSMGYMALAGWDTNQILSATSGILSLASASGEDLATVSDIVTDAMTGFGDSADQAGRYADVLATTQAKSNTTVSMLGEAFKYVSPIAGSYGYTLKGVSTALGMMANSGVKGSMAGTALSSIITRLGTNTNGARDAIEKLGVGFYNADGTARPLEDVMRDMIVATSGMTAEEKANFASTVAGQEAQKGLLAILNQGVDAWDALAEEINNSDGNAEAMANTLEGGLGGALRTAKSALEGVAITIGRKLSPYVQKVTSKITELCQWFQNLSPQTQETIIKILLLVAVIAPLLIIFGTLAGSIGSIITLFGTLKTALSFSTILTKLKTGFGLLKTAFTAITSPAGIVITIIVALVAGFIYLWNNSEGFRKFWINLWESLKTTAETVGAWVKTAITNVGTWFNEVKTTVSGAVSKIKTSVQLGFKKVQNFMTNPLENAKNAVKQIFTNIQATITNKITSAKNKVQSVIDKIKGFFNFEFHWPKIPMPHFGIEPEGWVIGDILKGIIPKLGVEWYAKGGILDNPTVFGMNGSNLMVGGEAGAEAIAPIATLKQYVSEAVQEQNNQLVGILHDILKAVTGIDSSVGDLGNMTIKINEREFGRAVRKVVTV